MDELPGPPFIQMARGAFSGFWIYISKMAMTSVEHGFVLCEPQTIHREEAQISNVFLALSQSVNSTHKPKEGVNRIVLLFAKVVKTAWR